MDLDRVLLLARYPRYLFLLKSAFGPGAELLLEELLKCGQDSLENVVLACCKRMRQSAESGETKISTDPAEVYNTFSQMASFRFIERCPEAKVKMENGLTKGGSNDRALVNDDESPDPFAVPNVDLKKLKSDVEKALNGDEGKFDSTVEHTPVMWRANVGKFHQDLRDQIIIAAVTRRVDASAGNLMRIFLKMVDNPNCKDATSNDIYLISVMDEVNR